MTIGVTRNVREIFLHWLLHCHLTHTLSFTNMVNDGRSGTCTYNNSFIEYIPLKPGCKHVRVLIYVIEYLRNTNVKYVIYHKKGTGSRD